MTGAATLRSLPVLQPRDGRAIISFHSSLVVLVSNENPGGVTAVTPLKLRPTGLGSGIDKDRPDYTVYTGEWEVGRIYETAEAQFQKSWHAWKAWAKLEELP